MRTTSFADALSLWSAEPDRSEAGIGRLLEAIAAAADKATNVTLVDVSADAPEDFRMVAAVHHVSLRASWERLGDYVDQAYMRDHVYPRFRAVKETGEPAVDTVQARIQTVFAAYDRLLLPCLGPLPSILSLTRTRMIVEDVAAIDHAHLTAREAEIVSMLASGLSAKEIAQAVALSPRSVEHRVDDLRRRFGARNVAHLVSMVAALRLTRTPDLAADYG